MIFDDYGATVVQACKLNALSKFTQIINIYDITDVLNIKLPNDFPRDSELVDIFDFDRATSLNFTDNVIREEHQPWIDINKSILDMSNGQHIYRLTFQRQLDNTTCICWFSYIVQNANEEKPYIYMKRDTDNTDDSGVIANEDLY